MNDIVRFTKGNKNDFIARNNSGKIIESERKVIIKSLILKKQKNIF